MILEPRQQSSVSPGRSSGDDIVRYIRVSIQQRHTQIIAAVIFVLLIIIELLFHHNLTAILAQIFPVILVVLLDAIIVLAIACGIAEPLAILAYLGEVRTEQRPSSKLYTPLSAAENLYETPPDSAHQGQQQDVRRLVGRLKTHVMILGLPGAGKTMALRAYQYPTLEHPWRLLWKRESIPVYVPVKDYNVFLTKTYPPTYTAQNPLPPESVLAYLRYGSELTGMSHLNPYLELLARRGRLLFLYDGLNEIDSDYLELVCTELTQAIHAQQNRLVMTCRELDYREQPRLRKLVEDHLVEEALILPLKMEQIEDFVERYVQADYQSTQRQGRSAYEINTLIKTSRLSYNCTNPMMLVTLIRIIDEFGIDQDVQIGTKGRLLNKFVFQVVTRELKQPRWQSLNEQDIMLFLSQVACTARLNKLRNAIQLGRAATVGEGGLPREMPIGEVADRLQVWLVQHAPPDTSITGQLVPQMPQMRIYTHTEIEQFLGFVQSAALIDVSQNGVLSFRHELIAEYFAAAYLHKMDTTPQTSVPFGNELVTDVGAWSEPVTIWAGMSNEPMTLAQRLASLGQSNPHHAYNALSLSLACTGVVWTPPFTQEAHRVTVKLPDNVTSLLVSFVPDPVHRRNLAATIKRCADEGGVEVYRSLLPLIMEAGIDDLLLEIDKRAIPELLFNYLQDAIETTMSPDHIDRLIYILGRFGTVVIARAKELSQSSPGVNIYLRVAAIKILGSSGTIQAVEPLTALMGDAEDSIREATAKALIQLGPGMALERVLEELKSPVPAEKIGKIHWTALATLRGFLNKYQLNVVLHQRIIEALLQALSSRYMPSVQEDARAILLKQAEPTISQQDEERWKRVVSSLIRALADMDSMKAPHVMAMLKQIGEAATPLLLLELKTSKLEIVRARIVEVLGEVRDQEALPPLLPYLADPSPLVLQQVIIALRNFAPKSIAPLIDRVLRDPVEMLARNAASALKEIGASSLGQVMQKLEPIVPGRTQLLIDVLVYIHQPQAIAPLIKLLKKLQNEADLSVATIRALGQFPEKQVVPPLLEVLISWGPSQYEEARKALSSFGELAFDELMAAFDMKMEATKLQRVRFTLLKMEPFLYERLLNTFTTCGEAQAQQIELIFLQKDDAAPFLVAHLSHAEKLVREHVYSILDKMKRDTAIPPLLDGLKNTRDYAPIGRLLRKYPESIPSLVDLLGDERSSDGAASILHDFGTVVIPSLVPGLDNQNPMARRRAQDILITLVQEEKEANSQKKVLTQVVNLFGKLSPEQSQSYAWDSLLDVLTNRFPEQSISVLLEGLGHVKVQNGSAEALVRLVRKQDVYSSHVRTELLAALRNKARRDGASSALVKLDAEVVDDVGKLTIDDDTAVALRAQEILSRIGAAALNFVWTNYRDDSHPHLRDASRDVFKNMQTEAIKDRLVELLTSPKRLDVEMALTLLLERIFVEDEKTIQDHKMIPALLQHVQIHSRESSNLRVIALLLLQRKEIVIRHMLRVLNQDHDEWLIQVFLLLGIGGSEAKDALTSVLNDPNTSQQLRREAAGIMGMMGLENEVMGHATVISKYGIFPNGNQIATRHLGQRKDQLEVSLRALGGLLTGGTWNAERLEYLRDRSGEDKPERDLYNVLLGKQYSSQIKNIDEQLQQALQNIRDLNRELSRREEAIRVLKNDNRDLKTKTKSLEQERNSLTKRLDDLQGQ